MDDRALVAAMVRGDPRGLDGAYRRYAHPLLAYCRATLRDEHTAGDVLHDTFVLASQRINQLRDPALLRPWLYAIARHECLRRLRTIKRTRPLRDEDDPAAQTLDLAAAPAAAQVAELLRAATEALSDSDRECVELALRHDLDAAAIARVLGVPVNHAHARLSRARRQLAEAVGVLLVARAAAASGSRCAGLTELLAGWDGRLTPLLRKRLCRHVDGCARCSADRTARFSPATLLATTAALPVPALLLRLLDGATTAGGPDGAAIASRPDCTAIAGGPDGAASTATAGGPDGSAIAATGGSNGATATGGSNGTAAAGGPDSTAVTGGPDGTSFIATKGGSDGGAAAVTAPPFDRRTGFPRQRSLARAARRAVAVAAVLVVAVSLGVSVAVAGRADDGAPAAAGLAEPTGASAQLGTPPTAAATPAATGTPSPAGPLRPSSSGGAGGGEVVDDPDAGRSDPPPRRSEPPPSRSVSPPAPALPGLRATHKTSCSTGSFRLIVTAKAEVPLRTATLYYHSDQRHTVAMEITNGRADVEVVRVRGAEVTWWVTARDGDGRSGRTTQVTSRSPC
jgi:RNA polymerase sigma factor (sigma-70 family)